MDLKQYRNFVENAEDCPNPFKNTYAGFILGKAGFIKDKLNQLKDEVESKDFAYKRAIENIIEPRAIINAVADYFKVSPDDLRFSKKRPGVPKQIAIYLLRRKTALTGARIGELFNMEHSAVSKAALGFERKIKENKVLKKRMEQISSKVEV